MLVENRVLVIGTRKTILHSFQCVSSHPVVPKSNWLKISSPAETLVERNVFPILFRLVCDLRHDTETKVTDVLRVHIRWILVNAPLSQNK